MTRWLSWTRHRFEFSYRDAISLLSIELTPSERSGLVIVSEATVWMSVQEVLIVISFLWLIREGETSNPVYHHLDCARDDSRICARWSDCLFVDRNFPCLSFCDRTLDFSPYHFLYQMVGIGFCLLGLALAWRIWVSVESKILRFFFLSFALVVRPPCAFLRFLTDAKGVCKWDFLFFPSEQVVWGH